MTSFVNRRQFMIEWGHCDPAGIVFNSRFFEFFDWGTWTLFEAALGVKPHELGATYGIMGIPLVDAGARFLAPARFGDVVELTSLVSEFRRSSFDVEHQLLVHGALAVEGKETRVWAARDAADPSKIKSQPIPPEVTARFEELVFLRARRQRSRPPPDPCEVWLFERPGLNGTPVIAIELAQ